MAKLTIGQKAQRALRFLMGVRNPRVAIALHQHGFTDADRRRGYELLQLLTADRMDALPPPPPDRTLIQRLDEWENRWFPIAKASVKYRYPAVHEKLFHNLGQAEGQAVVVTVETLLRRIDEMSASDDVEQNNAMAHLEVRGLTPETLGEARALLDKVGDTADIPSSPVDVEVISARETELWNWYLEWSAIARSVVTDRRLLRYMGFLNSSRAAVDAEAEPSEVDEESGEDLFEGGVAAAE